MAQDNASNKESIPDWKKYRKQVKGTYQIQMINTRAKPRIPVSIYEKVKNKRKDREIVYHKISSKVRVKILPKK